MSDAQQRMLRTILAGAPGFLVLKNRSLAYEVANPKFCQFVAKGPAEIVGKTDADLFSKEEAETSGREDRAVIQSGLPRKAEQSLTGPEGPRWFEMHRSPILDDAGEPAGVFLAAYEITAFKRREEAIREGEVRIAEFERQVAEAGVRAARAQEALAARDTELAALQRRVVELVHETEDRERQCVDTEDRLRAVETKNEALQRDLGALQGRLAEAERNVQQGEAVRTESAAIVQRLLELLRT